MAIGTNSYFHRRYWPAYVTLVVGLALSGGLGSRLYRQAVKVDIVRLQRVTNQVIEALDARVEKTELIMRQAQDYLSPQQSLTDAVFQDWVWKHDLFVNVPWCYGFAIYTNQNADQWREHLPPEPHAWTKNDIVLFKRLAKMTPIELSFRNARLTGARHIWPTITFQKWSCPGITNGNGFDIERSVTGNQVRSTGRQVFAYEKGIPQYGAALVLPLFAADREALQDTLRPLREMEYEFNWNTCRGMLVAPVDYLALESDIWNDIPKEVGVEIFASREPKPETWLNPKAEGPRSLDPRFRPYLCNTTLWKMYGWRWAVFIYSLPPFEEASPRRLARMATVAGTAMTLLATALVGVAFRARGRQELMTEQIREARDALAAAQQERQKLSHDLHDNTIQALYAIQLGLGHTSQKLEAEPASARREMSAVRAELDAVIAEVRRFIMAEENVNKIVDLSGVLHALAQRVRTGTTAQIEAHCDPEASGRLSGTQAVQLANIAREALSNSLRHAKPRQVKMVLCFESENLCLEVSDDGIGFDPQAQTRGMGLTSMTARTQEIGGTLDIQSAPGKGTRVVIRIPASPPEPAQAQWGDEESAES